MNDLDRATTRAVGRRACALSMGTNAAGVAAELAAYHRKHPLKLAELLAASESDFVHDVGGILYGRADNVFWTPRYAA